MCFVILLINHHSDIIVPFLDREILV